MNMVFKRVLRTACVLAALIGAPGVLQAAYPDRPITIVVPFPPGGGADILSRVVGQGLSEHFGVPVLVENRPGGNTVIAAQHVAKAKPDGYTVFTAIDATMVMNPALYSRLPYDPVKDFRPVTLATSMPMVLAVHPDFPARTLDEFIKYVREHQGQLSYAHGAIPAQVVGELFKMRAGLDITGVPYNGSAPAQQDVIGGHVPVLMDALAPALPQIRAGRIRPLAVTTAKRVDALPDVPAVAEAGVDGVNAATWTGFFVPAGTPDDIVATLHEAFVQVLNSQAVQERFAALGTDIIAAPGDEFARLINDELRIYDNVIKSAGIRIE